MRCILTNRPIGMTSFLLVPIVPQTNGLTNRIRLCILDMYRVVKISNLIQVFFSVGRSQSEITVRMLENVIHIQHFCEGNPGSLSLSFSILLLKKYATTDNDNSTEVQRLADIDKSRLQSYMQLKVCAQRASYPQEIRDTL